MACAEIRVLQLHLRLPVPEKRRISSWSTEWQDIYMAFLRSVRGNDGRYWMILVDIGDWMLNIQFGAMMPEGCCSAGRGRCHGNSSCAAQPVAWMLLEAKDGQIASRQRLYQHVSHVYHVHLYFYIHMYDMCIYIYITLRVKQDLHLKIQIFTWLTDGRLPHTAREAAPYVVEASSRVVSWGDGPSLNRMMMDGVHVVEIKNPIDGWELKKLQLWRTVDKLWIPRGHSICQFNRWLGGIHCFFTHPHVGWNKRFIFSPVKSAHTALAVKACLLGGNSNTKCSMTFVNIAVAISALAGGGGPQKRFRTETKISHRDKNTVIYSGFCSLCSKTSFFTGFRALRRRRIAPWRC